jgi:prepilin peptidase CpaA
VAPLDQPLVKASLSLTLLVVIALAVRQDLTERRISNVLTLAGLAAALALRALGEGMPGLVNALAGAGVGLACFLPLYLGKGMGAGDVKLMGAAGAFLGPAHAFVAALLSLGAGAALALLFLAWRSFGFRAATAGAPAPAQLRKERFPYAAAIGIGVTATMWLTGMLEVLVP